MEAKKTGHASHDKVVEQMTPKKEGHNSQLMNERVQEIFDEFMKLEEDKKEITKHQRELKAKAKLEYGILSDVFAHEIRLKKKEKRRKKKEKRGGTKRKKTKKTKKSYRGK